MNTVWEYSAEQVLCLLLHLALRYMPKTAIHIFLFAAAMLLYVQLVDWCRNLAVVNCTEL